MYPSEAQGLGTPAIEDGPITRSDPVQSVRSAEVDKPWLLKHCCMVSRDKESVPYFADGKGGQGASFAYREAVNTER